MKLRRSVLIFLVFLCCFCRSSRAIWNFLMETLGIKPKQYKPVDVKPTKYPSVEPLVTQARELISKSQVIDNSVVNILLDALEINPDDYDANYLAGTSLLALRKSEEAQGFLYKAVVVSNWTEHNGIANLAEALRLTGDFDLATKVAQKGISQFDNTDPAGMLSFTLGSIFFNKEEYAAAADWFLAAAIKQRTNVPLWLRASTLQFPSSSQEINFAKNVLLQGIEINPTSSDLYLYMGVAMQRDSKYDEAVTFYSEALNLDPNNFDAVVNMATSLHSIGRHEEAIEYYEVAYANSPTDPSLVSNYAHILSILGKHNQALGVLKSAIQANPNDATLESAFNIVRDTASSTPSTNDQTTGNKVPPISVVQSAIEEAVKNSNFDRVIQIAIEYGEPKDDSAVWWHFAVGMASILKGEHNTGYDLCRRAESLAPTSHLVHGCLGVGAKGLQQHAVAAQHFEKAYVNLVEPAEKSSLPSLGFYASVEDVQFGLLSTHRDSGNYERCLQWYSHFTGIPSWDQGGSLLIALTQVQWTEAMITELNTVENYCRDNGALNSLPNETKLLQAVEHLVGKFSHISKIANDCLQRSPLVANSRDFNTHIINYLHQQNQQRQEEAVPL